MTSPSSNNPPGSDETEMSDKDKFEQSNPKLAELLIFLFSFFKKINNLTETAFRKFFEKICKNQETQLLSEEYLLKLIKDIEIRNQVYFCYFSLGNEKKSFLTIQ